jgi:hypothetical protein
VQTEQWQPVVNEHIDVVVQIVPIGFVHGKPVIEKQGKGHERHIVRYYHGDSLVQKLFRNVATVRFQLLGFEPIVSTVQRVVNTNTTSAVKSLRQHHLLVTVVNDGNNDLHGVMVFIQIKISKVLATTHIYQQYNNLHTKYIHKTDIIVGN